MNRLFFLFSLYIGFTFSAKAQCEDIGMYDIFTPMGNLVYTMIQCEAPLEYRKSLDSYFCNLHPNAQPIITYDGVSSTRRFNCHGYAWIMVEYGVDRWIQGIPTPWTEKFIDDGSYIKVSQETYPGKVYWEGSTHSAITTEEPGWFISKWGEGPLFRHRYDDVYEEYGTEFNYYAKNCHNKIENEVICLDRNIVSCGDIEIKNVSILGAAIL